jgi:hypothetical protein
MSWLFPLPEYNIPDQAGVLQQSTASDSVAAIAATEPRRSTIEERMGDFPCK